MSNARKLVALWVGILAGPVGGGIDEVVGYTSEFHECSTGRATLMHGLSVGALALCGIGFLFARLSYSSLPIGTPMEQRQKTMAQAEWS